MDFVFHLAGLTKSHRASELIRVNQDGIRAIVEPARAIDSTSVDLRFLLAAADLLGHRRQELMMRYPRFRIMVVRNLLENALREQFTPYPCRWFVLLSFLVKGIGTFLISSRNRQNRNSCDPQPP